MSLDSYSGVPIGQPDSDSSCRVSISYRVKFIAIDQTNIIVFRLARSVGSIGH